MKKIKQLLSIGLVLVFILSSCTMEKRVYTSGYHINWKTGYLEWKNGNQKSNELEVVKNNTSNESKSGNEKNETSVTTEQSENSLSGNSELNQNNITSSTDNSIFIPTTSKINWNKKNKTTTVDKSSTTDEVKKIVKEQKKQHRKIYKKVNGGDGGKNQWVALALCFFLGWIGIHRFYLGYTGLGVMYLLFTLFGSILAVFLIGIPFLIVVAVLNIIDFIRIIIGSLKPKGGEYGTKI